MRWLGLLVVLALGACGDDDDDSGGGAGTGGGGAGTPSCAQAVKALCAKACSCGGSSCRVKIGNDVLTTTTQAECESSAGASCDEEFDYTTCSQDIAAASCESTPIGDVVALPASCDAP